MEAHYTLSNRPWSSALSLLIGLLLVILSLASMSEAEIHYHEFVVCLCPFSRFSSFSLLFYIYVYVIRDMINDLRTCWDGIQIQATPVKRLCRTHSSITVNGQFPGPTLEVRDGDSLVIKAINSARYNATLHW